MEISDLYAELLDLSPGEQQLRLAALSKDYPDEVADLADMLALSLTGITQLGENLIASEVGTSNPLASLIGQKVMGFTLSDILSEGGATGMVFLARQTVESPTGNEQAQHYAAVKVLRQNILTASETDKLFFRESSNLIAAKHPKICQLFGVDKIDSHDCIVTEYIDGRMLHQYLDMKRLTCTERLMLYRQVLEGMAFAHSRGLYHGDIKPQNILVDNRGQIKIIDLGFSRQFDDNHAINPDNAVHYINAFSRHWSAPEQQARVWYKARSDIYSLGVLLFYMLSLRWPDINGFDTDFSATNALCTFADIDPELAAIIAKATQPEAIERYRDADELLEEIDAYLAGRPVDAYSSKSSYRLKKAIKRQPFLSSSLLALILSVVGGTAIVTHQYITLLNEQRSNRQVINQMSNTLAFTRPALTDTIKAPSINDLFTYAAQQWHHSQQNLTPDARYQTGIIYANGLIALRQYQVAIELLSSLKEQVEHTHEPTERGHYITTLLIRAQRLSEQLNPACNPDYQSPDFSPLSCPSNQLAQPYFVLFDNQGTISLAELGLLAEILKVPQQTADDIYQSRYQKLSKSLARQVTLQTAEWKQLPLAQKKGIYDLLTGLDSRSAMLLIGSRFTWLSEKQKETLVQEPANWISDDLTASEKYQILDLASMVAYSLGNNDFGQKYDVQKQAQRKQSLPLNELHLSFQPVMEITWESYNESQHQLYESVKELISGFRESNAHAHSAFDNLVNAYLLIGDLKGAKASSQLLSSSYMYSSKTNINAYGTAPSDMTLAIWYRDWNAFRQAYKRYSGIRKIYRKQYPDQELDSERYFDLFAAILNGSAAKQDIESLRQSYLPYTDKHAADVYIHYARLLTGETEAAIAGFKELMQNNQDDTRLLFTHNNLPAWDDASALYGRLLILSGQEKRGIHFLTKKREFSILKHPESLYNLLPSLYLAEAYAKQGNHKQLKTEVSNITPYIDRLEFRDDLKSLVDKLVRPHSAE